MGAWVEVGCLSDALVAVGDVLLQVQTAPQMVLTPLVYLLYSLSGYCICVCVLSLLHEKCLVYNVCLFD